ncbi:hypothetical protein BDV95DRAFT_605763 [Massariosphaeria phaeospora]|uniref:Uncharacterized protein n=1 Tax=Massariosphaeria phaeospora TaxID=100035 RepID=A0A7C8IHP7_9PLEO|nr:hypothetical protein BDV95DRAFT_605763 [Massariosphaeria phaeospora]
MWKTVLGTSSEISKHAAQDAWKAVGNLGQEAGKRAGLVVQDLKNTDWTGLPADAKGWIERHPGQTAGIAAGFLAPPLAVMAVPAVLGAAGFTAGGVAAGSAAAGIQAGIGNVVAGSVFATLQSAAMGGAGAAVVNGVVGGSAAAIAVAANVPGLVQAGGEDAGDEKDGDGEDGDGEDGGSKDGDAPVVDNSTSGND